MKNELKIRRTIIYAQCAGVLGQIIYTNGFLLAYFSHLGLSSSVILSLLGLPLMLSFLVIIPAAYLSDHWSKRKIGLIGLSGTVISTFMLAISGWMQNSQIIWITLAVSLFGLGNAMFTSNWFALLNPLIPEQIRGRFFGQMRFSWQSVGILFTFIFTLFIRVHAETGTFIVILLVITLFMFVRILFYLKIPELEKSQENKQNLLKSVLTVIRTPHYLPFCSYVFLLMLFIGSCPWLFGLMEKDILMFSKHDLILVGNMLFIGSLAGFYFGGKMVDRFGTRMVFIFGHITFAMVLFLFALHQIFPLPAIITIGFLTTIFGIAHASSGIAITSEILALIPRENKSLSTAMVMSLMYAGTSLSAFLGSRILELNLLSPSWTLFDREFTHYDTIFFGAGMMIMLLIVTLGLVPSVVHKAQWIPGNR